MQEDFPSHGWMNRCVVLTPCASWELWVEALASAAEQAGLTLVVFHDDQQRPSGPGDNRIFVTSNARFISPGPSGLVAVIVVEPETAAQKTAIMTGAKGRDAVVDASRLLVEALLVPASCTVTDASLVAGGRRVELLPGVVVEAPPAAGLSALSDLDIASAAAFGLYHGGLPVTGATCQWSHDLFLYDPRRREERVHIQELDMTGGPRSLVHGPDMVLPFGEWEMTARFSMDQTGAVHGLRIEWGIGEDCAAFNVSPSRAGVFQVTIAHKLESLGPVELRIKLTEGCMGGYFEFMGGSLRLLQASSGPQVLRSELID